MNPRIPQRPPQPLPLPQPQPPTPTPTQNHNHLKKTRRNCISTMYSRGGSFKQIKFLPLVQDTVSFLSNTSRRIHTET